MVAVKRGGDVQLTLDDKDVHISYLPLAHVFERVMLTGILNNGGSIGFFRGDILLLIEDIQLLQPTLFCSVPRLLNRIYDKINAQVATANSFRQFLFRTALQAKLANLSSKGQLTHAFWDRLVFRKVKAVIGGRVRGIVTASAPISGETLAFLRVVFGCEVLEAYGQTECTGGFSMTLAGDYSKGHVGAPLAWFVFLTFGIPLKPHLTHVSQR